MIDLNVDIEHKPNTKPEDKIIILDKALRKFSRMVADSGVLKECLSRRSYVKPSDKIRRKKDAAKRRQGIERFADRRTY